MARRLKLLTGLSTIAIAGALGVAGCGGEGESAEGEGEGAAAAVAGEPVEIELAAEGEGESEGEGEGEGEGESEGEGDGDFDPEDRVAYFARLMLISGHLRAGADLYRDGDTGMALEHLKHPEQEIYLDLKPVFERYEAPGFDTELMNLYKSIKEGEPESDVEKRLIEARAGIEKAYKAASPSLQETLLATSHVIRQAGEEYAASLKNGEVVMPHEYQDAYGFMTVAVEVLGGIEGETQSAKEAVATARKQAAMALDIVPSANAPEWSKKSAAPIFAAAANIEIAALSLE